MSKQRRASIWTIPCLLMLCGSASAARHLGEFAKWATVEIELAGPPSQGRGQPNPFALPVDVLFTSPRGKTFQVPGFYDGDGRGGLDGSVWKVRIAADETGRWRFASRSKNQQLGGQDGTFTVIDPSADAPDFYRWGRLEAVGTADNGIRYLKFRDGPYWLKAGCDDPENFLGNSRHYNTVAKRKAAVDFLAERGVNSLYVMSHNIDGDDKDVWPWLGATAQEAKANGGANARFDVARLSQWRDVFEFMQRRGVVTYLVLEDDSAWKGYDHARYYREMIARFGDLPALIFNFGEEHNENYPLSVALDHMKQLQQIDPYDHPRGIHNVNSPEDSYIDAPQIDFTSIQTNFRDPLRHHPLTLQWIARCQARGKRILTVGFDEGRPEEDRRGWWAAYLGGGVWETHIAPPFDRPVSATEKVWTELGGARAFLESLPFWQMQPRADLVKSGEAFCLARPGVAYALYLPNGGTVTVELAAAKRYDAAWWNPANGRGGRFKNQQPVKGGRQTFTAPSRGDWALRIVGSTATSTPARSNTKARGR